MTSKRPQRTAINATPHTYGPKVRRKLRPLAALAMVALIGAGCSGNGSSGGSKNATDRDKATKFAECMRANGVREFPDASGEFV